MNLDLHKEFYFFEWGRKEQLAGAANLPVALLSVLAGGLFYLLQSFPYACDIASAVFVALAAGSLTAQVAGITYVIRALHDYWYQQAPASEKLQAYFDDLKGWHQALGNPPEEAQRDFDKFLQDRLAEATTANIANNASTAGALYSSRRSIVFALVLSGLSLAPYFWQTLRRDPPASAVKIEGPVNVRTEETHPMAQDNSPSQPQQGQTPPSSSQPQQPVAVTPAAPPKPVPPPNMEVRNSGEMREKAVAPPPKERTQSGGAREKK